MPQCFNGLSSLNIYRPDTLQASKIWLQIQEFMRIQVEWGKPGDRLDHANFALHCKARGLAVTHTIAASFPAGCVHQRACCKLESHILKHQHLISLSSCHITPTPAYNMLSVCHFKPQHLSRINGTCFDHVHSE